MRIHQWKGLDARVPFHTHNLKANSDDDHSFKLRGLEGSLDRKLNDRTYCPACESKEQTRYCSTPTENNVLKSLTKKKEVTNESRANPYNAYSFNLFFLSLF